MRHCGRFHWIKHLRKHLLTFCQCWLKLDASTAKNGISVIALFANMCGNFATCFQQQQKTISNWSIVKKRIATSAKVLRKMHNIFNILYYCTYCSRTTKWFVCAWILLAYQPFTWFYSLGYSSFLIFFLVACDIYIF